MKPSQAKLCLALASSLIFVGCGNEDGRTTDVRKQAIEGPQQPSPSPRHPVREVVYRQERTSNADGSQTVIGESGTLDEATWQRVARPYRHLGADEPYVYDEQAWGRRQTDGSVVTGYEVLRRANDAPADPGPDARPTRITDALAAKLAAANAADSIEVLIAVRDFPDWDVPLMPPLEFRSASTGLQLAQERQAAINARETKLEQMSSGIEAEVASHGGRLLDLGMLLRAPVGGACSAGSGAVLSSTYDASWDIRHMLNIESTSIAGACVEVDLYHPHVTSSGTTVTAFCYTASGNDDDDE